ncbi:MAG: hypothetical protein GOU99_00805, partial [Candidatus Altiarchaeota archaeon]|nr:hypothetical protein [Candidatus Altiarchaeota archaeon]
IEARKAGIDCQVIHAPSVINVISRTGLSSYKFGRIVTLSKPFESDKKKIESNLKTDLHTLVLLDPVIDMQMGLAILSQFNIKSKLIACARLGTKTEMIKYALAAELEKIDFGDRPHCLIIPAKLQFFEQEFLELF